MDVRGETRTGRPKTWKAQDDEQRTDMSAKTPHSPHRFPAPSSTLEDVVNQCLEFAETEECRKPVLGVCRDLSENLWCQSGLARPRRLSLSGKTQGGKDCALEGRDRNKDYYLCDRDARVIVALSGFQGPEKSVQGSKRIAVGQS